MNYLVDVDPEAAARRGLALLSGARGLTTHADILRAAGHLTRKDIHVMEVPALAEQGVAGLWFELPEQHIILQPPALSRYHLEFVQLHEVGHIVFASQGWSPVPALSAADRVEQMGPAELIERANAHRISFHTPGERAAELFAHLASDQLETQLQNSQPWAEFVS